MPLQLTAAYSSRVKRSKQSASPFSPGSSSPFSSNPRRKPSQSSQGTKRKSTENVAGNAFDEPLDDTGIIASLGADLSLRDVPQFIQYIQGRMFSDIPERAPGMNSTRIAEVLNYRISLPPVVTVAHVHALSKSATSTEREIAELAKAGIIRKVVVPNRGKGAAAAGEGLVLVSEWERIVRAHPDLEEIVKDKYVKALKSNPTSTTITSVHFNPQEAAALTRAGFLTTTTTMASNSDLFSRPGASTLASGGTISTAGSRAASGSIQAVGGADVFSSSGASGGRSMSNAGSSPATGRYNFALPNTGPYLRLLTSARDHIVSLLAKSKHREAPMTLLHERWDGGIMGDDPASRAKKARGESTAVLPGRTKKWKQFYGLRFEWVLEECVGAGLVECFETGSVGIGVRAV